MTYALNLQHAGRLVEAAVEYEKAETLFDRFSSHDDVVAVCRLNAKECRKAHKDPPGLQDGLIRHIYIYIII